MIFFFIKWLRKKEVVNYRSAKENFHFIGNFLKKDQ